MRAMTMQAATRAVLLIATVSPVVSAWYMQLKTTQLKGRYVNHRRSYQPTYLYQNGDTPLTFDSCIAIDYGNLRDDAKVDFWSLARDPPVWDNSKTQAENLADTVQGLAFFEGMNCDPLTISMIFRLDTDYMPGSHVFITSKDVAPPIRFGSWKPIWLQGQDGYSERLARIDVGSFEAFPPPQEMRRIMQLQNQRAQANTANLQGQLQEQRPAFRPIMPNTGLQTGYLGNTIVKQEYMDQIPRDQPNEMNSGEARLQNLIDQVQRLQQVVDSMTTNRENARNNRDETNEIFEEEKQAYTESSQPNEFMSPGYRPRRYSPSQSDPTDINNFFATGNYGNQESTDDWFIPTSQRRLESFFPASPQIQEENSVRDQGNLRQEEQAPEEVIQSAIQEEIIDNSARLEPNDQRAESENAAQGQIIEEIPQNQATGSEAQLQGNIQSQGDNDPQEGNQVLRNQAGMPPPTRPTRQQPQGINPNDIGLILENNRLQYANEIERLSNPYLDTMSKILSSTGQLIHETLVLMAKDTNTDHTDQYLAEIEDIVNKRKLYLTMNEDKYLEAARTAAGKLKESNAKVIGPRDSNAQQNPPSQQNPSTGNQQ